MKFASYIFIVRLRPYSPKWPSACLTSAFRIFFCSALSTGNFSFILFLIIFFCFLRRVHGTYVSYCIVQSLVQGRDQSLLLFSPSFNTINDSVNWLASVVLDGRNCYRDCSLNGRLQRSLISVHLHFLVSFTETERKSNRRPDSSVLVLKTSIGFPVPDPDCWRDHQFSIERSLVYRPKGKKKLF